jgi:predicted ATP-grasp superfamily ATP-dependent carboligase
VPGAVIIGGDYQGLGIVRSLGRKGIPVCVVDDEHSISRYSRYTSIAVSVPNLRDTEQATNALLRIGHSLDLKGWVLFPTRDELVAALSNQRCALSEFFRVPTPAWDSIQWIWDKRNTYKLAQKLGIPIPQTWFPDAVEDLADISAPFPLVLKPAIKEHFIYATKAKAWRATTQNELSERFQAATRIAGRGEILIQELIPGDGQHQFAYCAFFKHGKAVGKMVTCRRRQHPYEFGRASTFVETRELPVLEKFSERFLQAINYYGLVEVEYKRDPRDGQFKMLDVNARTWGYHTLGQAAGVDFPYLVYRDQLGEKVETCQGRAGVSWIRSLTDFPTAAIGVCRGRLSLGDYLQTLRHVDTEAVFSQEDPLPGLMECLLLPYMAVKKGF